MSQLPFSKYAAEFRKDHPETIGETDQTFDLSNYCEWLEKRVADRDALRAEVEALRHEVELTNEHEHQILTERNEARAELERTKEDLERVRRNHLRRMHREALDWADRMIWDTPDEWVMRTRPRLLALVSSIRAALERKDGA